MINATFIHAWRPGAAVVRLVGMQHDDLAGRAALRPAPVVEDLEPGLRHADRVRVVTMPGEGAAAEPGAEQLDAVDRPTRAEPVARDARTFKTLLTRPP